MTEEDFARRDRFDAWLAEMDDRLERFFSRLPGDLHARLDFSPTSLDALEAWLLERYQDNRQMREGPEIANLDGAARYVGQTFLKSLGGRWDIELDDPKNVFYRLPIVTGYSERSSPDSPHSLATASVQRRRGNYLSTVLNNMIKRYGRR